MLKKMSRYGREHTPRTPQTETFLWDSLALVRRNDEHFINEPHVGNAPKKLRFEGKPRAQRSARRARKGPRGNPVASSKGTSYFNDALGTTVGAKKDGKYSAAALSAFGEDISASLNRSPFPVPSSPFFTGKPYVEGLGHAFLMRNYRASLAKWQTADPMGYPDGWNQLAYCRNCSVSHFDFLGAVDVSYLDGFTDKNSENLKAAAPKINLDDSLTLLGHGDPNEGLMTPDGVSYDSADVAKKMKAYKDSKKQNATDLVCVVCFLGQADYWCQALADELRLDVYASEYKMRVRTFDGYVEFLNNNDSPLFGGWMTLSEAKTHMKVFKPRVRE